MNAKETLAAVRRSKVRLEALMERRRLCDQLEASHSGRSQALEQLQRELDLCIDTVARQELAAMRQIETLDDPGQKEVLRYRYLNGWAWKEIARRMDFSQDWVKHIHTQAMKAMES